MRVLPCSCAPGTSCKEMSSRSPTFKTEVKYPFPWLWHVQFKAGEERLGFCLFFPQEFSTFTSSFVVVSPLEIRFISAWKSDGWGVDPCPAEPPAAKGSGERSQLRKCSILLRRGEKGIADCRCI